MTRTRPLFPVLVVALVTSMLWLGPPVPAHADQCTPDTPSACSPDCEVDPTCSDEEWVEGELDTESETVTTAGTHAGAEAAAAAPAKIHCGTWRFLPRNATHREGHPPGDPLGGTGRLVPTIWIDMEVTSVLGNISSVGWVAFATPLGQPITAPTVKADHDFMDELDPDWTTWSNAAILHVPRFGHYVTSVTLVVTLADGRICRPVQALFKQVIVGDPTVG